MADRYVTCPLCGFEFERVDALCEHGCPLRTTCGLTRCPSCDYEFPPPPAAVSWLARLLGRAPQANAPCDRLRTVADLRSGDRAWVVSLGAKRGRRNTLAVFGLVPGSEVTLLQHHPACVVRVGETELALDADIAHDIVVERLPAADGG